MPLTYRSRASAFICSDRSGSGSIEAALEVASLAGVDAFEVDF